LHLVCKNMGGRAHFMEALFKELTVYMEIDWLNNETL
jgi:hypothetical protein